MKHKFKIFYIKDVIVFINVNMITVLKHKNLYSTPNYLSSDCSVKR